MSLLSDLDSHDRNPRNKWGLYSQYNNSDDYCNKSDAISDDDSDEEVCLITLSPQATTRKSTLRSCGPWKPQTVEIKDDSTSFRSNTDKNPKDFHAHTSSFIIPKTKKQTAMEKSLKKSPDNQTARGKWLKTGLGNGCRLMTAQLQLVPDAQGRAIKRTSDSSNDKPRKLRRPWNHAETPKSSDCHVETPRSYNYHTESPNSSNCHAGNPRSSNCQAETRKSSNCRTETARSCQKASPQSEDKPSINVDARRLSGHNRSRNADRSNDIQLYTVNKNNTSRKLGKKCSEADRRNGEEIRCALCNATITTKGGCLTCPRTNEDNGPDLTVLTDELSEEGFLVPVKRSPPGAGFITSDRVQRSPPGSGFLITSDRHSESEEVDLSTTDAAHETEAPGQSDSSQESQDFIKTPAKNDITQDDMFCQVCGKARTAKGCGCEDSQTVEKMKSAAGFYGNKRSGKTPQKHCGKAFAGGGNVLHKSRRTRCQANAQKKKANLKKKNPDAKQVTIDTIAETVSKPRRGRKKSEMKKTKEPECVHISSDEDEIPVNTFETTGNVEISETKDFDSSDLNVDDETILEEKTSLPDLPSNIQKTSSSKKQKKSGPKVATDTKDKKLFLIVNHMAVGRLFGHATGPVEITKEMIYFKMKKDEQEYAFRLEKNNLVSFKIHSDEPLVAFLTPTSGWARKFVERYWNLGHGHFISPHGKVYNDKHIILFISDKITEEVFEDLTELVNNHLSDEPILERMSYAEAKNEADRINESSVKEQKQAKRLKEENTSENSLPSPPVAKSPPVEKSPPVDKSSSVIKPPTVQVKSSPVVKSYSTRSKSVVAPAPKKPAKNILVYQPSQLHGVTITDEDILCLQPSAYLNDVIIDFFLKYIIAEKFEPSDRERIHLFNTFFYERLTNKITYESSTSGANISHRMGKWTKNVDIFSKDFLIIPINESAHWYLVIICFPSMVAAELEMGDEKEACSDEPTSLDSTQEEETQDKETEQPNDDDDADFDRPLINTGRESKKKSRTKNSEPIKARPCILIFDSLGGRRRPAVSNHLRNYLNCEWKERKDINSGNLFDKDTLKVTSPKVPFQENYSDCGLYVLKYFECFFTKPIEDYRFPIDLRSWFSAEEVSGKREYITNVIYELASKNNR